ncbi:hypothetical protein AVEN_267400-1, partial [Araneus ventricosus]
MLISGVTPGQSKRAGTIEERLPWQQSETEVGVLTAINGYVAASPERGTSRYQSATFSISQRKREPTSLFSDFSATYPWCPRGGTYVR